MKNIAKPIVNARNHADNHSKASPTFVPVDYEDHGYQMRILKNKLYELGGRQLSFGKYAKYELHWVIKNDPGYVNWCTRTPSPSNWMLHFLKDVNRYMDLKTKWDRVKTLDWELYGVNSSPHPVEWIPWREDDCIKQNRNPTPDSRHCDHPAFRRYANQHGTWWSCTTCDKRITFQQHPQPSGTQCRPIWFAGVVQIPVNYQDNLTDSEHPMIIMDSGCRRSVAGRSWHDKMIRWIQSYGMQPTIKKIEESFEFGGGEIVDATRALVYPILLNGHLVELDVAEVAKCPPLLSSQAMRSLGMELNYATNRVRVHSCRLEIPLEENKGGHPVLKFPRPTQADLSNVPRKYLRTKEMKEKKIMVKKRVNFTTYNSDEDDDHDHGDEDSSILNYQETFAIKKGVRRQLMGNVKEAITAYEEGAKERPVKQTVWHTDSAEKVRRRYSIMEICTWTMMVTIVAASRGWETWQPITIESGYDLTTDAGVARAKNDINKACPDVIVFAWVCTPWTIMQNMNIRVPGHAQRLAAQRALHMKMLSFAEWCERRQSAHGGFFLGENPISSMAWQQPPCQRMSRRCYEVKLDQCMFNLKAPDTDEPIKKATKMLTTSKSAARNLSIRCSGDHSHRVIEGSVTYSKAGKKITQSLSEYCGGYSKELALAMIEGFEEDLFPVSHFANVVTRKRALDELEEEAARRVARRIGEQEPASSSTDDRKKKKRRREFAEDLREATRRAKLPRPTTRSMARGSGHQDQDDDQEQVPQMPLQEAVQHWLDDMEENIPYIEPEMHHHDQDQQHEQAAEEETPHMDMNNMQNDYNYYQHEHEEIPYPHDHQQPEAMDIEEVPVQLYYPHDEPPRHDDHEHLPGPEFPHHQDPRHEHQEDHHHQQGHDETPQFVPEPGHDRPDAEMIPREEILTDLEYYGNDLAGGEGDIPAIIVRDVPPEVRREVRNAHYNLGHPSTATLLRLMRRAGANEAVQRYARWWKCPQCSEREAPGATPTTTAPYRPRTFNLMVGCDMKTVHDHQGNQFHTLNIIDFATTFQVLAMLEGCSAEECAEKFWLWWVVWAGPPKTLVTDMGTSFLAAFITLAERYSATSKVIPTEAPWQVGMIERHGGVINDVISMTVAQSGATGKTEMMLVMIASAAAKNRRPGLSGHSPRSAVFGMDDRIDGSVIDSLLDGEQLPAHSQAATDAGYQRALKIRQEAMKAIIDLDHSQRYHRAIAARPNLRGHQVYLPGAQVYYWQAQGARSKMKGRRRRQHDRWRGPGTVIGHEMRDGVQSNALWISHGGHLRLVAPQHVRSASPEEQVSEHDAMRRLRAIMEDFARSQMEFENLIGQDDPPIDDGEDGHHQEQRRTSRAASSQEDPEQEQFPDSMPDGRSFDEAERELFGDLDDDDHHHGHHQRSPDGPPMVFGPMAEPEEINVLKLKPTQKSKKGRELNPKYFDDDEREAFFKSDADQWQKHLDHGAVTVISPEEAKKVPKHMILPIASRFVRTDKGEKGILKASSRLVVPGHLQDGSPQEEGGERTDAPTVPQLGLHLTMTIAASSNWRLRTFDVSSAFLRGDAMDANVYFRPPREGLPGVPEGALIKAEKGVFGLRVAPRLWYKKARAVLEEAGWAQLSSLPGVFIFRVGKILRGLLVLHVDDALHAGEGQDYETAMNKILKTFEIPEDKRKENNFNFLGRSVTQQPDGTVHVTMQTYLDDVKPIFITKARRSKGTEAVTSAEKTELMSLVGQLAWVARESLPQVSFDVSDLQQRFNTATVNELVRSNSILRQAKKLVATNIIKFIPLNLKDATFVSVTDASFAGQPKGSSQMGLAVLIASNKILEGSGNANMIEWASKKIHRVVKSTLAAEAAAMSYGFDRTFFAREVFTEIMYGRDRKWRDVAPALPLALQLTAESSLTDDLSFPVGMATDCKSLYDVCIRPTSMPTEKRVTLDLLDVRHHLDQHPSMYQVRWIPTTAMLVDALTKHLPDQTVLENFLKSNTYSLREDPRLEEIRQKARADRKERAKTRAKAKATTSSSA